MDKKQNLRKIFLEKLEDFENSLQKQTETDNILLQLFQHPLWQNAKMVALTISLSYEFPTEEIIKRAWSEGKQVCLPKTFPNHEMEFFAYTKEVKLEKKSFGIFEPIHSKKVAKTEIDLIITPHLAMTKTGVRLGFGGGFYDRYLADFAGNTLSLAYSVQLVEKLPLEEFDVIIKNILCT